MRNSFKYIGLGLVSLVALSSCSDQFLEDKKNYDNANKDIYNYVSGCNGRLNDIYSWCLPTVNDLTWKYPSMGTADLAGKSTEEYSGFSDFVNPEIQLVDEQHQQCARLYHGHAEQHTGGCIWTHP